jgi:hypothetical protein
MKAHTLSPDNPQILSLISMTWQNMGNRDSALFYNGMATKLQHK